MIEYIAKPELDAYDLLDLIEDIVEEQSEELLLDPEDCPTIESLIERYK